MLKFKNRIIKNQQYTAWCITMYAQTLQAPFVAHANCYMNMDLKEYFD